MKKKVSFVADFLSLLVNILLFVRLTNIAGGDCAVRSTDWTSSLSDNDRNNLNDGQVNA